MTGYRTDPQWLDAHRRYVADHADADTALAERISAAVVMREREETAAGLEWIASQMRQHGARTFGEIVDMVRRGEVNADGSPA